MIDWQMVMGVFTFGIVGGFLTAAVIVIPNYIADRRAARHHK